MSIYYSPLRYPGGKNCVFTFISSLFYENGLIGCGYAEPYAGGAGLALRLLFEGYVERIFINDFDYSIYSFWKYAIEHTDSFCEWIEDVDVSIDNWDKYKKIQLHLDDYDMSEVAKSTFFLNRTNVSGVIKGGVIGGKRQNGKYKMDVRFNKDSLIKRFQKINSAKNRIFISNLDAFDFLERIDSKKEPVLVYLDPPYVRKGADLYMNFYKKCDHIDLSKKVYKLKTKWLVSYDNTELVLGLYGNSDKVVHKLSQSTSNRVGDEIFIFAKDLEFKESLRKLKSPIFLPKQ